MAEKQEKPGLYDLVIETSDTPGQGDFILNGAMPGRRSFISNRPEGGQVYYFADDGTKAEWGTGTLVAGEPVLLKRAIDDLETTDGTNKILDFSGTVRVYSFLPAKYLPRLDGDGNLEISGSFILSGDITAGGNIDLNGNVSLNGNIFIKGNKLDDILKTLQILLKSNPLSQLQLTQEGVTEAGYEAPVRMVSSLDVYNGDIDTPDRPPLGAPCTTLDDITPDFRALEQSRILALAAQDTLLARQAQNEAMARQAVYVVKLPTATAAAPATITKGATL